MRHPPPPPDAVATAAYGLRLGGLDDARWLGVTGAGHWPAVRVVADERATAPPLAIDLDGRVRIHSGIAHSELVHPLLGRLAGTLSLAAGDDAIHAGAVLGAGGAWAVIGPKMAGKSTLLAALALGGTPVVTDDVLVFGAGRALAGPRCIDLRPSAAHLCDGVAVRPDDPRHRIALPAIAAEHPLVGVLHLEWSDGERELAPLHGREALARLFAVQAEKGFPRRAGGLLDLAALPALALRRPRAMDALPDSVALVQRALAGRLSVPEPASKNPSRLVVACT